MALSRNYKLCLSLAVTAIFFFSITFLPPKSGGIVASSRISNNNDEDHEELRKMVLGSRPPGCVNKCLNCRPCEATLVIPPHLHNKINFTSASDYHKLIFSHRDQDGSYYLLSWKCRCGNKLYQP